MLTQEVETIRREYTKAVSNLTEKTKTQMGEIHENVQKQEKDFVTFVSDM